MPELNPYPLATAALLRRATTEYFWTMRQPEMVAGDLSVRFIGRPESWHPSSANGFACHGGVAGDLSWRSLCATNGFLQAALSFDGTAETTYSSTQALPLWSVANGWRWDRNQTTGDLDFYITRDKGVHWVKWGATVPTPPGPLHLSTQPIKVGVAPPGTAAYKGTVESFDLRVNSITVVNLDLTRGWSKPDYVGTHGDEWFKNGDPVFWTAERSAVPRAPQAPNLANMRGWTLDPASVTGSTQPATGTVFGGRLLVPEDCSVSKICSYIVTGPAGISGQAQAALHNLDGSQIGVTGDVSGDLTTGSKAWDLTAAVDLLAGEYAVKALVNAATPPAFATSSTSAAVNAGGSATDGWRFWTEDVGVATIPAVPAAQARNNVAYYFGVK